MKSTTKAPPLTLERFVRDTFIPQHCNSKAYSYHYVATVKWLHRVLRREPLVSDLTKKVLADFLSGAESMGVSAVRRGSLRRSFLWLWRCAGELELCPRCPIARGHLQMALPRPEGKPGTLIDLFDKRYRPEALADCEADREVAYFAVFRAMRKCFGRDLLVKELSPAVLAKYLAFLKDLGRGAATLRNHQRRLLALWRFAYREKLIKEQPSVRPIKIPRETPDAWSLDEVTRIIDAARNIKRRPMGGVEAHKLWPAVLLTIYYTAIRRGTLVRLSPRDIDLEAAVLCVPAALMKNGIGQKFKLGPDAVSAIREIFDPKRDRLFPLPMSRINDRHMYAAFRAILKSAGIKRGGNNKLAYFHKLRRTSITHTAARAGLAAAIALAGHSGPYVTARYIDPSFLPQNDATAWLPVVGGFADLSGGKAGAA